MGKRSFKEKQLEKKRDFKTLMDEHLSETSFSGL